MMQRTCLFAALLAFLSTTVWTSRVMVETLTDKGLLEDPLVGLQLSMQVAASGGRTLLSDEEDEDAVGGRDERREERREQRRDDREERREQRREQRRDDREQRREERRESRGSEGTTMSPTIFLIRTFRAGSSSRTRMRGVLRVVVRGNGESCFVKVKQRGMTDKEQFGDATSTSAFIDLFGRGECEREIIRSIDDMTVSLAGAKGRAVGFVRASVISEAHAIGDQCETKVISEVITRTRDLDPNSGISVIVGGAAGGEALAVCDG